MTTEHFIVKQPAQLHVTRCGGPLTVRGWGRPAIEIEFQGPPEALEARLEEGTLTVEAHQSCIIHCPRDTMVKVDSVEGYLSMSELDRTVSVGTCRGPTLLRAIHADVSLNWVEGNLRAHSIIGSLQVGEVGGYASLKSIEGAVAVGRVGSALRARHLGSDLTVQSVGGDLRVRGVAGSVEGGQVDGSLRAQDIGGQLELEAVSGNARIRDLSGGMEVERIGGDLRLEGALAPGLSYRGEARGDIALRLPTSTSARFDLRAQGQIRTDLPLTIESQDRNHLIGLLGEGGAQVTLAAGGDIRLVKWAGVEGEAAEWAEGLAEEIEQQVDEALQGMDFEAIGREVEARIAWAQRRLESVDWERLGREAQRAAEAGIAQAQEAIQRVLRRLEAWRDEYAARKQAAAEAPSEATIATDEERMAILRMVERGQITPDEGEMLLDALDSPQS